jgi:hypothetical protein
VRWTPFTDDEELLEVVRDALAKHLISHALQYGLAAVEYEALVALLLGDQQAGPLAELQRKPPEDGGAGGGGIILGPHSLPPGGVLLTGDD